MNVNELMSKVEGRYIKLDDYGLLEITGSDRERFLSGQTSNDVSNLSVGSFVLNSRLDRGGKLKTFFYHLKSEISDFLVVPKKTIKHLCEDLEKYIIMDEVEVSELEKEVTLFFSSYNTPSDEYSFNSEYFCGLFGFLPALILLDNHDLKSAEKMDSDEFNLLCLSRAVPVLGVTAKCDQLVTDTVVSLSGVSLSKGCFLGQETVAKIESRRGGAYLPVALKLSQDYQFQAGEKVYIEEKLAGYVLASIKIENSFYLITSLLRNYRIDQKSFNLVIAGTGLSATVNYLPIGEIFNREDYRDFLYEKAVHTFQNIGNIEAINSFQELLKVDPLHEDSLESMGVILGRMEKFEEGITIMDKVLEANPNSVMAHTNKSLFLMRLGKIEEAEEEKAQATVKSFASFGRIATDKKEAEKRAEEEKAEVSRRLSMFKQVLELDPEDELANYGMADVFHSRGKAGQAIPLLEKVIKVNAKYSVAYLLLGKCYLQEGKKEEAKSILESGINVASSLGDLMPANEMQNILSRL